MAKNLLKMLFDADNFLALLERFDRFIGVYGVHKGNERTVAVAFFHSIMSWIDFLDEEDRNRIRREIIVFRNLKLEREDVEKIYEVFGKGKTELDLFFINVPTIFGHKANLNFYIEVEMGKNIVEELVRLTQLRNFFKRRGKKLYAILVAPNIRNCRWPESDIFMYNYDDIKRIAYSIRLGSLKDIPGIAYDSSATSLFLLDYIARGQRKTKLFIKELWDNAPELVRMDYRKYFYKDVLEREDFNFSFTPRINNLLDKLKGNGLIVEKDGVYKLTINGRDLLIYMYSLLKV